MDTTTLLNRSLTVFNGDRRKEPRDENTYPIAPSQIIEPIFSENLVRGFFESLDAKPKTHETYRRSLKVFLEWSKTNMVASPKRQDILNYKRFLTDKNLSSTTIASYLVVVRSYFNFLVNEDLLEKNYAQMVDSPKRPTENLKDHLSIKDAVYMLSKIQTDSVEGLRNFAFVNLMVQCGLRSIETVRANIEDMRKAGDDDVLYLHGKGKDTKDKFVILDEQTLEPINRYLSMRGPFKPTEPLFSSLSCRNKGQRLSTRTIRSVVKKYLHAAGFMSTRLTCHSLRHSAVEAALETGADLLDAQQFARHASPTTTQVYVHRRKRTGPDAVERKIAKLFADASNNL